MKRFTYTVIACIILSASPLLASSSAKACFIGKLENGQKDHLFEFPKVSRRHQSPLAKFRSWSLSTSVDVDNVYIEYDEGRVQKVAEKKRAARIP